MVLFMIRVMILVLELALLLHNLKQIYGKKFILSHIHKKYYKMIKNIL